MVTEFNKNLSD